jgi:hypothetical protein
MTVVYGCSSVYLHFRVYNRACKPTLFEMVGLFLIIAILYGTTASLYYFSFAIIPHPPPPLTPNATAAHLLLRSFHSHAL